MTLSKFVSDFLIWIFSGLASLLGLSATVVTKNRRDVTQLKNECEIEKDTTRLDRHEQRLRNIEEMSARMERYFVGDENDPSDKGALQEIHEIREIVQDEHNESLDD